MKKTYRRYPRRRWRAGGGRGAVVEAGAGAAREAEARWRGGRSRGVAGWRPRRGGGVAGAGARAGAGRRRARGAEGDGGGRSPPEQGQVTAGGTTVGHATARASPESSIEEAGVTGAGAGDGGVARQSRIWGSIVDSPAINCSQQVFSTGCALQPVLKGL